LKRRTLVVAVGVVAILVVGGAYAVLTSSPPGNPCAGVFTGTNSTAGTASARPTGAPLSAPGDRTNHPVTWGDSSYGRPSSSPSVPRVGSAPEVVPVVAAENFWGSLVSQLGGNDTSVLSIVSDPNADPHEYEANITDAVAIAGASLVIVNGVGYDDWALQLIAADNDPSQVVLNVGTLNGVSVGGGIVTGNPHQWYNPVYVNRTVAAMYSDLVQIAPADASTFQLNYVALNASLANLYGEATSIKDHFAGTEVASTESIFVYLANFTQLDLVSPPEFMEAIAEGNDPSAQSVVEFQCQLESGQVKVLVYNEQTVTPITTEMRSIAASNNVTVIGVTETIQPPGVSFESWMYAQYLELYNALNADQLGQ
jgi:zinc/manganese transport system substrate-binding protein